MNERSDVTRGGDGKAQGNPRVQALRAAYRDGRLLVSADPAALERARLQQTHAIDARDVADALLRQISGLGRERFPRDAPPG